MHIIDRAVQVPIGAVRTHIGAREAGLSQVDAWEGLGLFPVDEADGLDGLFGQQAWPCLRPGFRPDRASNDGLVELDARDPWPARSRAQDRRSCPPPDPSCPGSTAGGRPYWGRRPESLAPVRPAIFSSNVSASATTLCAPRMRSRCNISAHGMITLPFLAYAGTGVP